MNEHTRALYSDITAILDGCADCKRTTCPTWCKDFTRLQLEEIVAKANPANYQSIYKEA